MNKASFSHSEQQVEDGFVVCEAVVDARTSSIDALEAFRSNPAGFDLVITDMTMPGMTGIEVLTQLRRDPILADIPVVVVSSVALITLFDVQLEQISLVSIIIALGLLVDNAVQVCDQARTNQINGMGPREAAIQGANTLTFPMLSGTLTTVAAFFPMLIGLEGSKKEYVYSLPVTLSTTLLISWIMAMTLTPVRCVQFLAQVRPKEGPGKIVRALQHIPLVGRVLTHRPPPGEDRPEKEAGLLRILRWMIESGIRYKIVPMGLAVIILAGTVVGFGNVKKMFFPDAAHKSIIN